MKTIKFIAFHLLLITCLFLNYFFEYEGFGRIAFFGYWFLLILTFITYAKNNEEIKQSLKNKPRTNLHVFFNIFNITFLIFCGWIVTAIAYIFVTLFVTVKRLKIEK